MSAAVCLCINMCLPVSLLHTHTTLTPLRPPQVRIPLLQHRPGLLGRPLRLQLARPSHLRPVVILSSRLRPRRSVLSGQQRGQSHLSVPGTCVCIYVCLSLCLLNSLSPSLSIFLSLTLPLLCAQVIMLVFCLLCKCYLLFCGRCVCLCL